MPMNSGFQAWTLSLCLYAMLRDSSVHAIDEDHVWIVTNAVRELDMRAICIEARHFFAYALAILAPWTTDDDSFSRICAEIGAEPAPRRALAEFHHQKHWSHHSHEIPPDDSGPFARLCSPLRVPLYRPARCSQ